MTDPLTRFDRHARAYAKGRPGYPPEVAAFVATLGAEVADIGAGTGLFTEALLGAALRVHAIEPAAAMREALVARLPAAHARAGSAEATGLPDASVDVVAAAQAAHWFEVAPTLAEWRRILRPEGSVVLVWNNRCTDDAFGAELDATLRRFAVGHGAGDHVAERRGPVVERLLGAGRRHTAFDNPHPLDADGFAAYVRSISYLPPDDAAAFAALDDVFARHARAGRVIVRHTCDVYDARVGSLPRTS